MRVAIATAPLAALVALVLLAPGAATAQQITCSQLPAAQRYVEHLRPGPNTRAAQAHIDAAKAATSDRQCVAELHRADIYAKRSAAADRRGRHPKCATVLHENRPGGTAYKGPPVAGCPQVHL
jgi:hypothetical protein